MSDTFPAKSVSVVKIFRAACHITGCQWTGTDRTTFQGASHDRDAHLTWHRQGKPDLLIAPQVARRDDELAALRQQRRTTT